MQNKLIIFVLMAVLLLMAAGCGPGSVIQIDSPDQDTQDGTPATDGQINVPGASIQIYAPGPNSLVNTADAHGRAAGILLGLWHGIISPITLVLSYINSNMQMYEVHNDGSPYNLGFLFGVAILFVLLGATVGSRR